MRFPNALRDTAGLEYLLGVLLLAPGGAFATTTIPTQIDEVSLVTLRSHDFPPAVAYATFDARNLTGLPSRVTILVHGCEHTYSCAENIELICFPRRVYFLLRPQTTLRDRRTRGRARYGPAGVLVQ